MNSNTLRLVSEPRLLPCQLCVDQLCDPGCLWDIVGRQAAGGCEGVEQCGLACIQRQNSAKYATNTFIL